MCHASQMNDQMCCGKCGLQWDVNDPVPPVCGEAQRETRARTEYVEFIRRAFNVVPTNGR